MPDDPRLNDHPVGGTDGLLQGLNTLTPEDLAKMREILSRVDVPEPSEDPKLSPRTIEYMTIVRRLLASNASSLYNSNSSKGLTRDRLYKIYDEMDESTAYITAALDIMSDDATQPDDDGNLIYIETKNEKVRNVIERLFEELEVESKLSRWARAIAKYGDLFIRVYGSSDTDGDTKGITSIDDTIYPSRVSRKDFRGKLIAFVDENNTGPMEDQFRPPWDYVHFRHKGDLTPESGKTTQSGLSDEQLSFNSSYGQSILRAAIKVYTQLRFVENMILLSRLTNSVRRNIFAINVGETDPKSSFETIKMYADLLKKDINLDMDESVYKAQKHAAQYDEDIFIPVSDPKNDFTVTSVGGDVNIAEQYDLEYLLNKLFAALKVPKAYLNYEQDLNARSTLIQLDIRYARSVAQLQKTIVSGLRRLVDIHLAYIGMDPEMIDYVITLTGVSSIDQESRLEQKNQRVSAARDFWDVIVSVNDTLRDHMQDPSEIQGGTNPIGAGSGTDFGSGPSGDLGDQLADLRSGLPDETEAPEGDPTEDTVDVPEESAHTGSKRRIDEEEIEASQSLVRYNSPLDLEYLASKLFSEYLEFSEDEVNKILRRTTPGSESKTPDRKPLKLSRDFRVDSSATYYPNPEGRRLYESTLQDYRKAVEEILEDEEVSSEET